jgi:multidrug efflux pump subunit AcrA (membrane-fusion protein)
VTEADSSPDIDFDDDAAAFLSNLTGEPIEKRPGAEDEDEAPETEAGSAFQKDEADETGEKSDPEDAEFTWGEGDKATKAKLSDLKAAYVARAESTAAATQVAAERAQVASQAARATTALTALVTKAQQKWAPFANLDFLALSKDPNISSEDFTALRQAAQEALTDYRYLTSELEGTQKAQADAASASNAQAVQACIAELKDPAKGLEGFGPELYNKLVDHAVSCGAPKNAVLAINQPWAIKMLNDAMLYRQGLKSAEQKVAVVKNKATGVMKPSAGSAPGNSFKQAMKNLRTSHSQDDAVDAFLASFDA